MSKIVGNTESTGCLKRTMPDSLYGFIFVASCAHIGNEGNSNLITARHMPGNRAPQAQKLVIGVRSHN